MATTQGQDPRDAGIRPEPAPKKKEPAGSKQDSAVILKMETGFSRPELDLLKRTIAKGTTDDEFALFVKTCRHMDLDPFQGEIHAVVYAGADDERRAMAIQVGIGGLRKRAEESGKYAGQLGPYWCGEDGQWREWWDTSADGPPKAAKVGILRTDFKEPIWSVAYFNSYAQRRKGGELNAMWKKMGAEQLAKCAEALGLRRAFPRLSGLYAPEEFDQRGLPIGATAGAEETVAAEVEPEKKTPAQQADALVGKPDAEKKEPPGSTRIGLFAQLADELDKVAGTRDAVRIKRWAIDNADRIKQCTADEMAALKRSYEKAIELAGKEKQP